MVWRPPEQRATFDFDGRQRVELNGKLATRAERQAGFSVCPTGHVCGAGNQRDAATVANVLRRAGTIDAQFAFDRIGFKGTEKTSPLLQLATRQHTRIAPATIGEVNCEIASPSFF